MVALVLGAGRAAAQDDQPPPTPAEEQPEVLTSGPVNEAFAAPVNIQDQGGVVAPTEPPAPIAETPPADKPAGDQFTWVPGYWNWDTERTNWIWVSACWRAAPPKMAWVPGYWCRVTTGWQWVPGFWNSAADTDLEYLPAPPAPAEIDAPGSPPDWDDTWVPGCWFWVSGRWTMRHGYWLHQQHGWIWSPAHVGWTPHGYLHCPGHWDLSLERRGVLFAPILPGRAYLRAGWRWEPSITIDIKALVNNLFVSPRYCHYFVGDYYDPICAQHGIFPRGEMNSHACYDPIYLHATWFHHDDLAGWKAREHQNVELMRSHVELRPTKTYREQVTRVARMPEARRAQASVAQPLSVTMKQSTVIHFERATPEAQRAIAQQATAQHAYRDNRAQWETGGKTVTTTPAGREHAQPTAPATSTGPGREHTAFNPQPEPPRGVDRTESERVHIPAPPVSGASERQPSAKTPPPSPQSEPQGGGEHGGGGNSGGGGGNSGGGGGHGGGGGGGGNGGGNGGGHGH
jgi:hypothetical protein